MHVVVIFRIILTTSSMLIRIIKMYRSMVSVLGLNSSSPVRKGSKGSKGSTGFSVEFDMLTIV